MLCLIIFLVACNPSPPETPGSVVTGSAPGTVETEPEPQTAERPAEGVSGAKEQAPAPPRLGEIQAPEDTSLNHARLLNALLFSISSREEGQAILDEIAQSGDTRFVAGLIDVLRYQRGLTSELGNTLNHLTEQNLPPDWFEWVEWAGKHPELESFDGYVGWKANLFSKIDPDFLRFLYAGVKVAPDSRPEEIVWGGVAVDGIPALDNPKMVDPGQADYLVPQERVFGVSINGDTRAYPARFLDWHEMFNDVVGGEPVSLAY